MAFARKILVASFTLANGVFAGGGNSLTTPIGLRVSARINQPGGPDFGTMNLAVYGLSLSHMNALTVLPTGLTAVGQNTVTLMGGDDPNNLVTIFTGTITVAFADANAQPQVCFRVQALGGHVNKVKPAPAISVSGPSQVSSLMGQIAQSMGLALENSGVNIVLRDVNLPGSPLQQASSLAQHAGIQIALDGNTLAIYPAGQARNIAPTTISAANGMVGYPSFTNSGLLITTLYQGSIRFGCPIIVQSTLTPACGNWFVHYVELALDANIKGGQWFAYLQAGKTQVQDDAGN